MAFQENRDKRVGLDRRASRASQERKESLVNEGLLDQVDLRASRAVLDPEDRRASEEVQATGAKTERMEWRESTESRD